jgi:putative N-acetyltransferase (TIGR04045 family)
MSLTGEKVSPTPFFFAGEYHIEAAIHPWQIAGCFALRAEVFCNEQKIFVGDDRDEIDESCLHLVAASCMFSHADEVVGTVRIHQPAPCVWWGSRLAVAAGHRRIGGLGASLIRLAVGTAKAQGAETFLAHVQAQNAPLFEAMDWHRLDEKTLHGHPHYLMQADLSAYAALDGAVLRVLPSLRRR